MYFIVSLTPQSALGLGPFSKINFAPTNQVVSKSFPYHVRDLDSRGVMIIYQPWLEFYTRGMPAISLTRIQAVLGLY